MKKYGYLFPGVGMGKNFYDSFPLAREIFDEANDALGMDLASLCFEGPEEELNLTFNTQPAILTVSYIAYRVLESEGVTPAAAAGHSLGEYSALAAGGAMSFSQAVSAVRRRGEYMQEAVPVGKGSMAAILGMDREKVETLCRQASSAGVVEPANYNCPGQVVVSGSKSGVEHAVELARLDGAKKAMTLPVSAPFHSSLMKPVEQRLDSDLEKINFGDPLFPVIANVSAEEITRGDQIRSSLVRQVSSPVLWEQSMSRMLEMGMDDFLEVGPGRVLSGLLKRIPGGMKAHNVEDLKSLDKTLRLLHEQT
jgi:[acyl-carrier-protein] S-malonyltransferase